MPRRQHSGTEETSTNCTDCSFSWGKDKILYCMYSMARQHSGTNCINCTVSSQWIIKQTNAVSSCSSSQTMLEGLCGCIMACNVFLAGNSEVSLELQCFTAELITYIHSVLVRYPEWPGCTSGESTQSTVDTKQCTLGQLGQNGKSLEHPRLGWVGIENKITPTQSQL